MAICCAEWDSGHTAKCPKYVWNRLEREEDNVKRLRARVERLTVALRNCEASLTRVLISEFQTLSNKHPELKDPAVVEARAILAEEEDDD